MTDKVVDASAIVALLFNELTRDEIVLRLRGATLHAPNLIGFEVANACLKKIRAVPAERQALLEAFSLLDGLSISLKAIDLGAAIVLAERTKLTLYDASYLWLARALGAELVTLDDKLGRADQDLRGSHNRERYIGMDNVAVVETSGAIPEPSTWAMMLLGFAGVGYLGYRRARGPNEALSVG